MDNLDSQQIISNTLPFKEGIGEHSDPMTLDIPDDELVKIVDERIKTSEKFYENKYNLKSRREKNETMLFGRQIQALEKERKLKDYETRSSDNALYEIEASLKPLAMSKLPDMIVTSGVEGDEKRKKSAEDLTIAVNDTTKRRETREVLSLGFKHLPAYFTAVLKARWDSSVDNQGDRVFEIIHPEYIVADHTATNKNSDKMQFIAQLVPSTVQDMFMKFPSKKDELTNELKSHGVSLSDNPTWKELATEVKYYEVWFDWFRKKGDKKLYNKDEAILEPGIKWEKVTCVLWKYEKCLLGKMLDPNFDWEGEDMYFTYDVPGDETTKHEVTPEMMMMNAITGQPIPNMKKEKIYHNYFKCSRKPYYFFGYDQWGKIPYDETSRIEQNARNQENLDAQNKSIIDQIKQRIKHIWSKDSGMKAGDVQKLDLDDPKMDALVEGDPNKVHASVNPERPDQAQFTALTDTRSRMYAISGATAVRGQLQSDVATSNQIAREADFTRADDLVEDTINSACEWIAGWDMHFIKLRYTEEHMRQILGGSGATTYVRLRRDMPSDGMEVKIKSSSTDKLKAQRNAMETAKLGPPFTNPIDFFKDMDMDDPEGRTERGLMFMSDPAGYFAKYALHLEGTAALAGAISGGMPVTPGSTGVVPNGPGNAPQSPQNPMGTTPTNTSAAPVTPPVVPQGSPRMM